MTTAVVEKAPPGALPVTATLAAPAPPLMTAAQAATIGSGVSGVVAACRATKSACALATGRPAAAQAVACPVDGTAQPVAFGAGCAPLPEAASAHTLTFRESACASSAAGVQVAFTTIAFFEGCK